jgi:hypothetical protein
MSEKTAFCWDAEIDADIAAWLRKRHENNEASKAIRAAIRATMQDGQTDADGGDAAEVLRALGQVEAKLSELTWRLAAIEEQLENL